MANDFIPVHAISKAQRGAAATKLFAPIAARRALSAISFQPSAQLSALSFSLKTGFHKQVHDIRMVTADFS
jgi:hypothetical protein